VITDGPPASSGPVAEDLSRVTQVVLVRHALPLTGVTQDPSLAVQGRFQADRAGAWLRWENPAAVVSSPYLRALETAQAIAAAAALPVGLDEDLREWSARRPDQYITPEMLGDTDRGRAFAEGRFADFVPVHDRAELTHRMTAAITRAARPWPGRTVIAVSHGGAINNLLAHVLDLKETFFFNPGYAGLSRIQVMPSGRMVVLSVNETAHLLADRHAATEVRAEDAG